MNKMSGKKKINSRIIVESIIFALLFLLLAALAIYESSMNGTQSGAQSDSLAGTVGSIVGIPDTDTETLKRLGYSLRKLIGHYGLFFADGLFLNLFFFRIFSKPVARWISLPSILIVMFLLAALTEGIQMSVPGRGPSWVDVGIDFSGAATAALICYSAWGVKWRLNKEAYSDIGF